MIEAKDKASPAAPGRAERVGGTASALADRAAEAKVGTSELIGEGFRPYERFAVELPHRDGGKVSLVRDLLRIGRTVGVIALDLARDEIVVIRQFRLAAHLSVGLGDLVEIPAGYVNPHESAIDAVRRECLEEIGVEPRAVREIYTFMPAPGILDEHATIFIAAVDAAQAPAHAGAAYETEQTRPIRVRIDDALAALREGAIHNGYLIMALQWIALNRDRLPDLLRRP
jgi:ADP-ribose pyrophosphatase